MTGSKCLLDTSVIIKAFKSSNTVFLKLDEQEEVYVSVTAVGELFFGAYNSGNIQKHLNQIKLFLNNCTILQIDITTSDTYGNIKASLAKKGKPIPENDIWIAAIAIQYNLPLFTFDKHFSEIDGLKLL